MDPVCACDVDVLADSTYVMRAPPNLPLQQTGRAQRALPRNATARGRVLSGRGVRRTRRPSRK